MTSFHMKHYNSCFLIAFYSYPLIPYLYIICSKMENDAVIIHVGKYTFHFSGNKNCKKIKKVLDFGDRLRYDITCH